MSGLFETGELNTYVYDSGGLYRRKYVQDRRHGENKDDPGVSQLISTGLERLEWNETTRGHSFHSKLFVSILNFREPSNRPEQKMTQLNLRRDRAARPEDRGAVTWAASALGRE